LHVIEDKEVRPLGGEQARRVDTRIVAATNRNLADMVKEGTFREDLFFRLSMFHIHIPPLRDRRDDIARLIRYVLQNLAGNNKKPMELDPMAEELLNDYAWPGNVRELENVINRANILADGGRIALSDLPPDIARNTVSKAAVNGGIEVAAAGGLREQLRRIEAEIIFRTLKDCASDRKLAAQRLEIGLSSLYRKIEEFEALGMTRAEA
jgi:two-component system response regulator AtoC